MNQKQFECNSVEKFEKVYAYTAHLSMQKEIQNYPFDFNV